MNKRLPTHLEISGLIRLVETNGGGAMVLHSGEKDAGTILLVTMCRGQDVRLYERMPQLDGTRSFVMVKSQDTEKQCEFSEYVQRRVQQDPDIWVLELDIDDPERFIALLPC